MSKSATADFDVRCRSGKRSGIFTLIACGLVVVAALLIREIKSRTLTAEAA